MSHATDVVVEVRQFCYDAVHFRVSILIASGWYLINTLILSKRKAQCDGRTHGLGTRKNTSRYCST